PSAVDRYLSAAWIGKRPDSRSTSGSHSRRDGASAPRKGGHTMFTVIIWGSDGSEHADRALAYARTLAEATSARLVAVHVKENTLGRGGGEPRKADTDEV